jgi:hypothetical protein
MFKEPRPRHETRLHQTAKPPRSVLNVSLRECKQYTALVINRARDHWRRSVRSVSPPLS